MPQGPEEDRRHGQGQLPDLLEHLLVTSGRRLDTAAGSISLVDASWDRYAKMAEHGASCQLGSSFPLDEGVTGQVVARRGPVVLARYSDVRSGHLAVEQVAHHGAVAAVPIWWRGDVVGANVVFAGCRRRFSVAEIDELELLTQAAAPDIVRAGADEPALAHLLRHRSGGRPPLAAPQRGADGQSALTPRERETLVLLARGLSNRQMATILVLSPKTVEKHVAAVLRKTGAGSRTGAVMTALERGWLPPARDRLPGDQPGR
jgi:DNA-binding CsgD family transcriptional regulator